MTNRDNATTIEGDLYDDDSLRSAGGDNLRKDKACGKEEPNFGLEEAGERGFHESALGPIAAEVESLV